MFSFDRWGDTADADSILRIVEFFDELTDTGAPPDELVREAAALAGCGVVADGDPVEVRVLRPGGPHPLDPVVAERLRRALRLALARPDGALRLGDPGLPAVAVSERERRDDRLRALELLGFDPVRPVTAFAVVAAAPSEAVAMVRARIDGPVVRAPAGRPLLVLAQTARPVGEITEALHADIERRFPSTTGLARGADLWIGAGEALAAAEAPESWNQACRAVRFASSTVFGRRAVPYGGLGSLALLAELPPERLSADPDVRALDGVSAAPGGELDVEALESYCVFGALRRTATELRLHHSTVAARLARVEAATGWKLDDPVYRFQATLALLARRVRDTDRIIAGTDERRPERR